MKLHLPDVTLVALDTVCHDLTMLAVKECMDKAQFGAVHIHTNDFAPYQRAEIDGAHFPIEPFPTVDDAMTYLWYGVPQQVETSHFLMVQWDSGIVSPAQWSDDFSATTMSARRGAGMATLTRSAMAASPCARAASCNTSPSIARNFPLGHPEDGFLCRRYRPLLEQAGFRWAPMDAALRFSFERTGFSGPDRHFGYHGIFNWPRVFSLPALQERTLLTLANKYLQSPPAFGRVALRHESSTRRSQAAGVTQRRFADQLDSLA